METLLIQGYILVLLFISHKTTKQNNQKRIVTRTKKFKSKYIEATKTTLVITINSIRVKQIRQQAITITLMYLEWSPVSQTNMRFQTISTFGTNEHCIRCNRSKENKVVWIPMIPCTEGNKIIIIIIIIILITYYSS